MPTAPPPDPTARTFLVRVDLVSRTSVDLAIEAPAAPDSPGVGLGEVEAHACAEVRRARVRMPAPDVEATVQRQIRGPWVYGFVGGNPDGYPSSPNLLVFAAPHGVRFTADDVATLKERTALAVGAVDRHWNGEGCDTLSIRTQKPFGTLTPGQRSRLLAPRDAGAALPLPPASAPSTAVRRRQVPAIVGFHVDAEPRSEAERAAFPFLPFVTAGAPVAPDDAAQEAARAARDAWERPSELAAYVGAIAGVPVDTEPLNAAFPFLTAGAPRVLALDDPKPDLPLVAAPPWCAAGYVDREFRSAGHLVRRADGVGDRYFAESPEAAERLAIALSAAAAALPRPKGKRGYCHHCGPNVGLSEQGYCTDCGRPADVETPNP
jgi:hypothetical protein